MPSDGNNNSTSRSAGECINNNTILATGVFTSAELYRLARAPITSQTSGHQQRSHHIHAHHHPSLATGHQLPQQLLVHHHQQLHAIKLEEDQHQSQYCSNNGTGDSRNTNGFSPDSHAHHSHPILGSPNPIPLPQTSIAGSSSASSSPSYVVGMSHVSDLPPHKRLRRVHPSDAAAEAADARSHQVHEHQHQQPQYGSWSDSGHSDSDASLIKTESSSGSGLYTHLHMAEAPLAPHPSLYHHMQQQHAQSMGHPVHQQQQPSQQQVLKYQENGDTLSDFVNLVSALSCPSDGHFWPEQPVPHQSSSHHGSDPSDEMDEAKSMREEQQEEDDLRDQQQAASHQLQVMAQYGHLPGMQLPPPPPPPTARPVLTPGLESRWGNMSSPPSAGYLLPEKDVSLGYFRPAFFLTQGLSESSAQLMLMPQQQQQHITQRDLSSPVTRSNLKGSPSPPKSPS